MFCFLDPWHRAKKIGRSKLKSPRWKLSFLQLQPQNMAEIWKTKPRAGQIGKLSNEKYHSWDSCYRLQVCTKTLNEYMRAEELQNFEILREIRCRKSFSTQVFLEHWRCMVVATAFCYWGTHCSTNGCRSLLFVHVDIPLSLVFVKFRACLLDLMKTDVTVPLPRSGLSMRLTRRPRAILEHRPRP